MNTIPSASFQLSRAPSLIRTPVTKFGGEPCWLDAPQWPLSRQLGVPMSFLGQVAFADVPSLPENLRRSGRVAYLFMTRTDEAVVHTCEPEGGENAVVIQPGGAPAIVATREQATDRHNEWMECAVQLTAQEDPATTDEHSGRLGVAHDGEDADSPQVARQLRANKLGGVPCFIQGVEYPAGDNRWHLLLQLREENPLLDGMFNPSFDGGRAHVFISDDGLEGRLLWQYQP